VQAKYLRIAIVLIRGFEICDGWLTSFQEVAAGPGKSGGLSKPNTGPSAALTAEAFDALGAKLC
jgi:hypothetical protein